MHSVAGAGAPLRRANLAGAKPRRLQSHLLARHPGARRPRADDVSGQKRGRQAWLGRQAADIQGVVYVDRQRKRSIPKTNADIAAAMAKGEPVVLFAEATTGDGNRLLRFRSSHFEAARMAARDGDAVVQPVFLHFTRLDGIL